MKQRTISAKRRARIIRDARRTARDTVDLRRALKLLARVKTRKYKTAQRKRIDAFVEQYVPQAEPEEKARIARRVSLASAIRKAEGTQKQVRYQIEPEKGFARPLIRGRYSTRKKDRIPLDKLKRKLSLERYWAEVRTIRESAGFTLAEARLIARARRIQGKLLRKISKAIPTGKSKKQIAGSIGLRALEEALERLGIEGDS